MAKATFLFLAIFLSAFLCFCSLASELGIPFSPHKPTVSFVQNPGFVAFLETILCRSRSSSARAPSIEGQLEFNKKPGVAHFLGLCLF